MQKSPHYNTVVIGLETPPDNTNGTNGAPDNGDVSELEASENANSEDVSELERLVAQLQADKAAILSEHSTGSDATVKTIEEVVDNNAVAAIINIRQLMDFAESEHLQFSASKYIVDLKLALEKEKATGDGAVAKLLAALTAPVEVEK